MSDEIKADENAVVIPMSEIHADEEFNCRGEIAPHTVIELANDMKAKGLLYPVVVRTGLNGATFNGKKYSLVAGFRRYTAAKINSWTSIRATIMENLSEVDAREINLRENLFRENLNVYQEAKAIAHFFGIYTDEEIGRKFGQSRGWVQVRRNLLKLPYDIQMEAAAGMISQNQIKDIANLSEKEQYEAVRVIKDAKLKGEKPRKPIKKVDPHKKKLRGTADIFELQDRIIASLDGSISESPEPIRLMLRALGWAAGEVTDAELEEDFSVYLGDNYAAFRKAEMSAS